METEDKAYTLSDLTCSIDIYSTNQSNHFLRIIGDSTKGSYNIDIVKVSIKTLVSIIKEKEVSNNEI
jgi:hypothetical protein